MKKFFVPLLIAVMSFTACSSSTSNFVDEAVLKIDGQEIMKSEYMVHLYTASTELVSTAGEEAWNMDFDGQSADELLESHTINTLQNLIAAKKYADENGITLTDEEKETAKTTAEQFLADTDKKDLQKMGIDEEQLITIMEDSSLYSKVYETIYNECTVTDDEVDQFFEKNKAGLMEEFQLLQVNSIVVDDLETAETVLEKAKAGEDFATLFDTYDVVENVESGGENGEMTVYRYSLESQFGLSPDASVGDIEGPFHMGSTYFVLKIIAEKAPDEAEVKKLAGETYRSNMQAVRAEERMAELSASQTVEKIDSAWNTLENFH